MRRAAPSSLVAAGAYCATRPKRRWIHSPIRCGRALAGCTHASVLFCRHGHDSLRQVACWTMRRAAPSSLFAAGACTTRPKRCETPMPDGLDSLRARRGYHARTHAHHATPVRLARSEGTPLASITPRRIPALPLPRSPGRASTPPSVEWNLITGASMLRLPHLAARLLDALLGAARSRSPGAATLSGYFVYWVHVLGTGYWVLGTSCRLTSCVMGPHVTGCF